MVKFKQWKKRDLELRFYEMAKQLNTLYDQRTQSMLELGAGIILGLILSTVVIGIFQPQIFYKHDDFRNFICEKIN